MLLVGIANSGPSNPGLHRPSIAATPLALVLSSGAMRRTCGCVHVCMCVVALHNWLLLSEHILSCVCVRGIVFLHDLVEIANHFAFLQDQPLFAWAYTN